MNRTTWLQDRRMQKFRDVLSRWERKERAHRRAPYGQSRAGQSVHHRAEPAGGRRHGDEISEAALFPVLALVATERTPSQGLLRLRKEVGDGQFPRSWATSRARAHPSGTRLWGEEAVAGIHRPGGFLGWEQRSGWTCQRQPPESTRSFSGFFPSVAERLGVQNGVTHEQRSIFRRYRMSRLSVLAAAAVLTFAFLPDSTSAQRLGGFRGGGFHGAAMGGFRGGGWGMRGVGWRGAGWGMRSAGWRGAGWGWRGPGWGWRRPAWGWGLGVGLGTAAIIGASAYPYSAYSYSAYPYSAYSYSTYPYYEAPAQGYYGSYGY
jgi:hypothetical protein